MEAAVRERAARETSPAVRAEWNNLAETYASLARQSESREPAMTYDPIWDLLKGKQRRRIGE
jgi:hypothetical protein